MTTELIDEKSYYQAFKQWLDSSNHFFDFKNEDLMNEKWLNFADEVGIELGVKPNENQIYANVIDKENWKLAKKYYTIISFKQKNEQ